jgi:AcrR family transcriptional regulator
MSTGKSLSLVDRQTDLTRRLILDTAVALLEGSTPLAELTVRAVAKQANVSERTVFRYFPTRDEFLDAVATAVHARMALPAPPSSREELLAAPRELYTRFEAVRELTRAALHTELFHRIRESQAKVRWTAIQGIVDALAPRAGARERKIAAANIRFYLAASTWHYFRFYFRFTLEETIACAESAIRQSLDALSPKR